MKFNNLLILPFLLPLFGFVDILSTKKQSFTSVSSPALESFDMKVIKKRFRLKNEPLYLANYMNDLRIQLKTKSVSDIQSYGVVQFIKGCKWESRWDGKKLEKLLTISRDHFGEMVTFIHSDWEVDSDSSDPVYHSYQGDRFALWRWNKNPASDDPETATYMHFKLPPHPSVFFTDLPGTSFRSASTVNGTQTAKNSTLEFKTCLFNMQDLPEVTTKDGSNIDQSRALHCFEWQDKWEFDFKTQTMKEPKEIDSICSKEL